MMLIRSQDRKTLMPIGTLEYGAKPYPHIENTFDGVGGLIGKYTSESRCLEILDEIQEMFTQYQQIQSGLGPSFMFDAPKVFQMPEK